MLKKEPTLLLPQFVIVHIYKDYEFSMVLNYWIVHTTFLNMQRVCQFESSYIYFLEGDNEQKRRIYIYCKLSRLFTFCIT